MEKETKKKGNTKKKEVKEKKVKKINKKKEQQENIKIYEKCTCFVVGIIILLLVFAVIKNSIFIPALLITVGLELFCISSYYIDDKEKKSLVYGLFEFGVFLVVIAIIYTIVKTI